MRPEFILIELNDKLPERFVSVNGTGPLVPAPAYTVLAGIEAEEIVRDATVRRIMDVSSRISNLPRPIDYMFAFATPMSDQENRTIAGRLHIEEYQLERALDGLRSAPGVLAVQPAKTPLVTARFKPFVFPGKYTEEYVNAIYRGSDPDPDAPRRLLIERFMNKFKPNSFDA
jgi:hypothetical protein